MRRCSESDSNLKKDVMSQCRSILLLAAALLSIVSGATVADVRQSRVLTQPAVQTQQPGSAVKALKGLRGLLGSTKRPEWWPLVECVFLDNVNKCLQDGTVRNLVGLGRKDEVVIDEEKEIVKIPGEEEAGLFDVIGDLVSDGFSRFFSTGKKDSADDSEEEDSEETSAEEYEDGGSTEEVDDQEDSNEVAQGKASKGSLHDDLARGHKKKKKKWKRAFFKLVLMGLLVKLKIAKLIFIATKLIQFKAFLLYVVNTVVNILRLYNEFKNKKKKDNPVLYYEQAQHHHLYDEHHHVDPWSYPVEENPEDKGWLGGLWSRSGGRKIYPPGQAHDLAYSAYKPEQVVATVS